MLLPNAPAISLRRIEVIRDLTRLNGKTPFEPHHWRCEHSGWLALSREQRRRQLQHRCQRWDGRTQCRTSNWGFGIDNTAVGAGAAALLSTSGLGNTANGSFALSSNGTNNNNTAVRRNVLANSTAGSINTAVDVVRCLAIS